MHSPITILLAEDNPGDVFLVRRRSGKARSQVELVVVEEGQAALRYMDAWMPTSRWRLPSLAPARSESAAGQRKPHPDADPAEPPRASAIPIIIVTSSDSPLDRDAAAKLGATGYFQKPGDLAGFMQLGQVVRDALDRQVSLGVSQGG